MAQNADYRILIADDEPSITAGLSALLEIEDYRVATVNNGAEALKLLRKGNFDLILADLMMPGLTGLDILREVNKAKLPIEVIIITGQGSIDTAVEAMKEGAYDYLTKPVDPKRIRSIIPKALERHELVRRNQRLKAKNRQLEQTLKGLSKFGDLIGSHEKMRQVYDIIDAVADTTANVLITGESGTGKELVAAAIHQKSSRAGGPFIAVNCSAFPRDILE
ncbi:MAG: response regulator, partial [Calditrichaeota bacterium]|nr:response regulator [Calditrichota bacterium]